MIQTSIEGSLHCSFFDLEVRNPRTHIKGGKAQYTDYEIHVQTNHPHFPLKESRVRRRYSEFSWLRQRLCDCRGVPHPPPHLPASTFFGKFKSPLILQRVKGFQQFLKEVVEEREYLLEPALHMFLQTELSIKEMDGNLNNKSKREIRYVMIQMNHHRLRRNSQALASWDAGRGWSAGIKTSTTSLPDLGEGTDGRLFDPETGCQEACALPGGRLTLYEVDEGIHTTDTDDDKVKSWHGTEHDMVDLWLEEYDIIPIEAIVDIEIESSDPNLPGLPCESSDDGRSSIPDIKTTSACDIAQPKKTQLSHSPSGSPPWAN